VQPEFEMVTTCASEDKDRETEQKAQRRKEMKLLFEKLRKIQDSLDKRNADFKEQIRFQMMNARKRIEELESGEMTEDLFEAHNAKDEEAEKFDYGKRDISRKPLEVELNYFLPYFSLPLLQNEYNMLSTNENYSMYNFIFVSGKQVDARLNFVCSI